jgi:hypothetical protein
LRPMMQTSIGLLYPSITGINVSEQRITNCAFQR